MMVTLTEHCRCGATMTATLQISDEMLGGAVNPAETAERLQREWRYRHERVCSGISGGPDDEAAEAAKVREHAAVMRG